MSLVNPDPLRNTADQSAAADPHIQRDLFAGVVRPSVPRGRRNELTTVQRTALLEKIDAQAFNPEQRAMVEHVDGPFLGLAGAGSGKTHAATYRIARLVACGVRPGRILAVTFTRKAAEEMKDRTRKLLRDYTHGLPAVKTLHSLGFKILREHGEHLNYKNGVRILSDIYADQLLQRGLDALGTAAKRQIEGDPIQVLQETISGWKNDGYDPTYVQRTLKDPLAPAYIAYQKWLVRTGFVDFDDLVRLPTVLFTKTKAGPEILKSWQERYDYITVDEYQDTNGAQEDMLCLLAQNHRNLCVVGDDDQSIYGWRGANVKNIREFPQRWTGSRVAKLELNYRSSGHILNAANALIAHSAEDRHEKVLRATREMGVPVELKVFTDEIQEAQWIADSIKASGRSPGDFAVLVRDQYKAKAARIEEALADAHIPYEVWFNDELKMGPTKRNAYSFLAAVHNPAEEEPAFLQLLKTSRFSLNDRDYSKMLQIRDGGTHSLWSIMSAEVPPAISEEGKALVRGLHTLISTLHQRARVRNRTESLSDIAHEGFRGLFPEATADEFWNDPKTHNEDTIALRKIVKNVASHERTAKPRNKNLSSYLNFQLVEIPRRIREGDTKKKANEERTKVTLMTMHGSKGLEFPVVYLPAFVENVIPHERTVEEAHAAEPARQRAIEDEELRLAYVAVTRAKEELVLSFPQQMNNRGRPQMQQPSRYLGYMNLMRNLDASAVINAPQEGRTLFSE